MTIMHAAMLRGKVQGMLLAWSSRNKVLASAVAVLAMAVAPLRAQTNTQAWYDVEFDYVITPRLLFNVELGPKVLVSGGPGWNSVDVTPGFEYSARKWADLLLYAPVSATTQREGVNTFEVRWSVGARLYTRPNHRLILRNRNLVEYRSISFGRDSAQASVRARARVEARYAINRPMYAGAKTLYALADFEGFLNVGKEPSERFLNRFRFRAGLGYRFNHWWTVEGMYMHQASDNTLDDADTPTTDHIIRLRMVHFLN